MRLPGVCIDCRASVWWSGKSWRSVNGKGIRHRCPAVCGAWMPNARERCARLPGHSTEHRSLYTLQHSWVPFERCDPPRCILKVGHAGSCRPRFWTARKAA